MSASRLLRILQTLPAGAYDEICAFNTDEPDRSMDRTSRCTNPFISNEKDNHVEFWNNRPELESSSFANEFTSNQEDEMFRKCPQACNVDSHLLANTTGFRIDKHSVECELPELIVCYKESDFHVKDICIDEETVSIHKDNNHEFQHNSAPVNENEDDHDEMIEASPDTEFVKPEWLRRSTMACCYTDELNLSDNYGPDNSTNTCEKKLNSSTDQLDSNSMISLQQDWSLRPLNFPVSSDIYDDDINQHPLQGSKDELGKRPIVRSAAEKLDKDRQLKNIFNESKTEESVVFHFDTWNTEDNNPSTPVDPESIYELHLETESNVNQQDVASGYKLAVKNHETRYVEEESSFSMAGVISELISCSRPMPLAGGISTRSDSSATSTRSFAFPA
ncbi:hypothetical protein L1987_06705 [Smallanthus sonchifolius]|uniref:Uncharacterized protein n=1 Tax=Smallanthus sonchifolius TaxID=185202 RepID=A0ACB9JZ26_9ASTR|nr:hypothetical protein L1987_06705 [Smallanthus sonchifolius]